MTGHWSAFLTSPAGALTRVVLCPVLLDHPSHHGDGGVHHPRGGAGGGGPGTTRAPGGGWGCAHSVLGLPGRVHEELPHAVCCHLWSVRKTCSEMLGVQNICVCQNWINLDSWCCVRVLWDVSADCVWWAGSYELYLTRSVSEPGDTLVTSTRHWNSLSHWDHATLAW